MIGVEASNIWYLFVKPFGSVGGTILYTANNVAGVAIILFSVSKITSPADTFVLLGINTFSVVPSDR